MSGIGLSPEEPIIAIANSNHINLWMCAQEEQEKPILTIEDKEVNFVNLEFDISQGKHHLITTGYHHMKKEYFIAMYQLEY